MIPTILVNGVALDLENIEYRVTVSHGRNDITAPPQPSDASMTLLGFTSIPVAISDVVEIEAYGEARFTGRVTDTSLTHDFNPNGPTVGVPALSYVARIDVTMIGNLSRLGLAFVGAGGYAKELLNDRVENILTDAGLSYANNSDPLMTQEPLDALDGGYSALDLLTALGTETGGTLCDLPDGAILWESYSRRGFGYNPATWLDIDVLDTWADINTIWADVYDRVDTAPATIELPAHAVTWSPLWRNTSQTILNDVTVVYKTAQNQTETDTDPASIMTHGRRAFTLAHAAPLFDRRAGPGLGHHPHPVRAALLNAVRRGAHGGNNRPSPRATAAGHLRRQDRPRRHPAAVTHRGLHRHSRGLVRDIHPRTASARAVALRPEIQLPGRQVERGRPGAAVVRRRPQRAVVQRRHTGRPGRIVRG
jgi:hypothetical protein